MGRCATEEAPLGNKKHLLNIPGTSCHSRLLLPLRLLAVVLAWTFTGPLFIIVAMLRAVYLRLVRGRPSQILKFGAYNGFHQRDLHYPCLQVFEEPLDEPRLKKALIELCAEDGIREKDIDLKFFSDQPKDWPLSGSFDLNYFLGFNYLDYGDARASRGDPPVIIRMHVWNGLPGKPTVMFFYGSLNGWDGCSNFNFCKEVVNRYMGNPPNKVFQKPEITAEAAAKFDQCWFLPFLLKMPFVIAKNWFNMLWIFVRSAKWAGGNGIAMKATAMNFTEQESNRLYSAARKLGFSPFAIFTHAAVKACREVLGETPLSLTQQASLQARHFPLDSQIHRDLVGDWLCGPVQAVSAEYGLKEAMAGYTELQHEVNDIGPRMREAIMAKSYGILNSGASLFQCIPTYNSWHHPFDRCIFMNNYGVREMPPGSPFHTWNWNAPYWFGFNTINVDGCTTTLVGSMFWGLEVVEAMRDNIEETLRDIMDQADLESLCRVPTYGFRDLHMES